MLDIAVFAALGWERRAVTAGFRSVEPVAAGWWTAALDGGAGRCLVVQTGMGQERARAAARSVPAARMFVSAGCAGALVAWLRPGDLVIASAVVPIDRERSASEALPADPSLAGWAARRGFRVHVGPIVSSEVVLDSAQAKSEAASGGALAVEMEGAAIALEARSRGIPFVDLRVVLDVQGQAVPAFDVLDAASGEIRRRRVVAALAMRPWSWPAVARLGRQTRLAERSLRAVVAAALESAALAGPGGPDTAAVAVS